MSDTGKIIGGFIIIFVVLPVLILLLRDCTRRSTTMQYSNAEKVGLVIAGILGGLFVSIGAVSFWPEQPQTSITPIADFVFIVSLFIVGLLIWTAIFFRYRGGFWSIAGAFLVAGALTGTVSIVESHIRGWQFNVAFYARIASCWIVGVAFLLIGHRRHRRKTMSGLKTPPETPQTPR